MKEIDELVQAVMANQVTLNDLSLEEMYLLLTKLQELNQVFDDDGQAEAAQALSDLVTKWAKSCEEMTDMDDFELAIQKSQERGNTYFEFDTYTIQ